jgi:hypothetical protein
MQAKNVGTHFRAPDRPPRGKVNKQAWGRTIFIYFDLFLPYATQFLPFASFSEAGQEGLEAGREQAGGGVATMSFFLGCLQVNWGECLLTSETDVRGKKIAARALHLHCMFVSEG